MRRLVNSFVLALLAAIITGVSGYLINQFPELPNKEKNFPWIATAVAGTTLLVGVLAFLQQSPGPDRAGGAVVRGNKIKGNRNEIRTNVPGANVSSNRVDGDDNSVTAEAGDPSDKL